MKYRAKPILIAFEVEDPERTTALFSRFLGVDFSRTLTTKVLGFHTPVSGDGLNLAFFQRFGDQNKVTIYFAVPDLDAAIREVQGEGGRVLYDPFDMPIPESVQSEWEAMLAEDFTLGEGEALHTLGRCCEVLTGTGENIGLVQLEPYAEQFYAGPGKAGIWANSNPMASLRHQGSLRLGELLRARS